MIFSVLDLGSNSFHWLSLAVDKEGHFSVVKRTREIFRLREGKETVLYEITPEKMESALGLIRQMVEENTPTGGHILRVIATSATRDAVNKNEFVNGIKNISGAEVEIISGEKEAKFIASGIRTLFPVINTSNDILFDIGGGSTEFIFERGNTGEIYPFSLELGSVRLMKRFFVDYELNMDGILLLEDHIRNSLHKTVFNMPIPLHRAIGSSGSINILHSLAQFYGVSDVPLFIPADFILDIGEKMLQTYSVKERERIFRLETPKAQIVPVGIIIIRELIKKFNLDGVYYSTANLKEGVILEMYQTFKNTQL